VPARPGPRGGHKLTEEVLAWAEEQLAADPSLRPAQLPGRIDEAFGVRVHPRSVERALARRRERHSKSRGTARPRDGDRRSRMGDSGR
jgi:transposase